MATETAEKPLLIFSGIAISILKALNPLNKSRNETIEPLTESTQPTPPPSQPQQPIVEVSIDAVKETNGLSGDTVYAGKKLVIP